MTARLPLCFAIGLLAPFVFGGEMLILEDFDKMDLKTLPAGYNSGSPGDLSVVDDPARSSKVLKISGKGKDQYPFFAVTLDAAKVKGHSIRLTVMTRFPGNFTPIPDKAWAKPLIQFVTTAKDKKDPIYNSTSIEPNKPEWVETEVTTTIDKDATKVEAILRVDLVAAEVYFDDFSVELDPDPKSPAKTTKTPVSTTPVAATVNDAVAAKAPKKALEDAGLNFGPEIASALQKALIRGATPNTISMIGPGMPLKDLESKLPEKWTRITAAKEFFGPAAGPRALLSMLPEHLAKDKPEVVYFVAEIAPLRKPTSTEKYDWEDLARLTLRMGAIPVFFLPPAVGGEGKDELRNAMIAGAEGLCPVVDLKSGALVVRRSAMLVDLLEKFVFCRVKPDAPAAGVGKPVGDE